MYVPQLLALCPCCGSKNVIFKERNMFTSQYVYIQCRDCGIRTADYANTFNDGYERAYKAWNFRYFDMDGDKDEYIEESKES